MKDNASQQKVDTSESITYKGNVTLKLAKDKKILKVIKLNNTGTLNLLRGIALYLLKYPNINLLPSFMGIGGDAETIAINSNSLKDEFTRRRVVVIRHNIENLIEDDEHIGYQAKYSASFPSEFVSGKVIKEIGLFADQSGDTLLARISIDEGIQVEAGLSLIVEWRINIQNK